MTINAVEQSSCRADFDAVSALRTIEPAAVSSDDRIRAAISGFDGIFAHPFVANSRAAFADDTALRIVGDNRRQIFFRLDVFLFGKTLFDIAPIENDFLQFALAAAVTDRTIERVICQKKFAHRALRLFDLVALRRDDHPVGAGDRAGRLQFRHLFDPHETHPATRLKRKVFVITK